MEWKIKFPDNHQGLSYYEGYLIGKHVATLYKTYTGFSATVGKESQSFSYANVKHELNGMGIDIILKSGIDFATLEKAQGWAEQKVVENWPEEDLPLLVEQLFYTHSKETFERRLGICTNQSNYSQPTEKQEPQSTSPLKVIVTLLKSALRRVMPEVVLKHFRIRKGNKSTSLII